MKLSKVLNTYMNEARQSMAQYPKVSQLLLQHSEEERSYYDMARDLLKNDDFKNIVDTAEKLHTYSKTHKRNPKAMEELIPKVNGAIMQLLDIYSDEYVGEIEFTKQAKEVADAFVPLAKKEMKKSKGKKISGINITEKEEKE